MKIMSLLGLAIRNNLVEGASAHWWSQRVSAFFLAILFLWFTFSFGNIENYEYEIGQIFHFFFSTTDTNFVLKFFKTYLFRVYQSIEDLN